MPTPNPIFSVGELFTSSAANSFPRGLIDSVGATATTAIVGGTELTVLSKSMTITAGRSYKISGSLGFQPSSNSGGNYLAFSVTSGIKKVLWFNGTTIGANLPQYCFGSYITTSTILGVTSGTASKTFNLLLKCSASGGLNTNPDGLFSGGAAEQLLYVEDLGTS